MPIISAFPTGESTVDYTGPKSGLPSLEEGKVAYVTDEKRLYTGNADGTNTQVPNEEDVSNAVSGHDSDENAHADKFAKYLPLEGGTMTGSIIAPSNTSAIRNSTNSSRVSIYDETAGLASGTVSVLCNSSNSDNPNLTLSAGSTNLYVSDANGTVQMTRTKDITHDNDITDKKYVDSAIQVAIQDTWEASY